MLYFKQKNLADNQKGLALVMALLILTLISISVTTVSRLILGEIKMSTNTGNSVASFHAAESGIEKSLYYLKYGKYNSDFTYFDSLDEAGYVSMGDARSFRVTTSTFFAKDFVAYDIATSSAAYVDIIDPAGDVLAIDWSVDVGGILPDYYKITWYIEDCFPLHASDKLETTISSFDSSFANPSYDTKIDVCGCGYTTDRCSLISYSDISPNRYYRFAFRPLDSNIQQLSFNVYGNSSELGIKSEVEIQANGDYHNSKYHLQARLPSLSPISRLFSYVIFSEQDIIKDL